MFAILFPAIQLKTEFAEAWVTQTACWEIGYMSRDGISGIPGMDVPPQGHL